ncbi:gamma-glutamylcyclotransferase-like [Xyrichtys novacula]|uniref:Gamma-glutamylcyclotransferase-like n=1 Tax=Xyrichtys novacula TaxID=13765 RepID=A0AAV1FN38_XYRNO|nr:gamma-glutamylcyclotransferase-like [Xyrichtys novacula]
MIMVCECWKAFCHSAALLLCMLCYGSTRLSSSATIAFFSFFLFIVLLLLIVFHLDMEDNHTFLYFAYGSNLLKERLQLRNPSATVFCVAQLKDYKLVFGNYKGLASERWQGGVATIEHSPGDEVWGVVWRMNTSDLESLDSQENVTLGAYSPAQLAVKAKGQDLSCRTYIMNSCVYAPPSPQYLQVIMMGAEQNGLPKDYQEKLRAITTNMYKGPLPMMAELDRVRRAKERDLQDYQDFGSSKNQVHFLL